MDAKKDDRFAYADLSIGEVAMIRMGLKDSIELAERYYEKFVSEKRSKKMIKQAKWNIEHAKNKIHYFEDKIQYSQIEWILNYFRIFSDRDTYQQVKWSLGKKWY